jgi:hypothetical protein
VLSDVPALLMAGEFDVITPPTFLADAAAGLARSYRFRYPATGHAGIDFCRLSMTLAFFDDPSKAPSGACIAGLTLHFDTAAPAAPAMVPPASMPQVAPAN